MFDILEHTADTGFRTRGADLKELFGNCALALIAVSTDPKDVQPRNAYPLAAAGEDLESLLVNWLNEVLYYLDAERIIFNRFEIREISPREVKAIAWGEPRDDLRHPPRVVVKGVTYHQLAIKPSADGVGWVAEVFLDI